MNNFGRWFISRPSNLNSLRHTHAHIGFIRRHLPPHCSTSFNHNVLYIGCGLFVQFLCTARGESVFEFACGLGMRRSGGTWIGDENGTLACVRKTEGCGWDSGWRKAKLVGVYVARFLVRVLIPMREECYVCMRVCLTVRE